MLKRLRRGIESLPDNWTMESDFAIRLDRSISVFDFWIDLSEYPEKLQAAILEVDSESR